MAMIVKHLQSGNSGMLHSYNHLPSSSAARNTICGIETDGSWSLVRKGDLTCPDCIEAAMLVFSCISKKELKEAAGYGEG